MAARTGSLISLLSVALFWSFAGLAAEVELSAQVDRDEIGLDETVELRLQLRTEGSLQVGDPQYDAPDFELVNQFQSQQTSFTSFNGVSSTARVITVTLVLHPRKLGPLQIKNIRVPANGQTYRASDLTVTVSPGGGGTPPPRGYGSPGLGLRGSSRKGSEAPVFIQTEISKDRIVKGEQLVVSYFLYSRIRIADAAAEKYPELGGFLKEEIDVPAISGRFAPERVVRSGIAYDRYLVARYAAYPLKEGKLTIDPLNMKYSYIPQMNLDFDDPDPLQRFFGQLAPKQAVVQGKTLTVEVLPLPEGGKPATFTGGVGEFSVTTAVDKYQLNVNEALNLKVKIEGRGNLGAIGEPRAQWPSGIEVYDSKGSAKLGKGGVGEKVFDYVLIPRSAGKLTLPALEFSFFDPREKKYYVRKTDPIDLTIDGGTPGAVPPPPPRAGSESTSPGSDLGPGATAPAGGDLREGDDFRGGWRGGLYRLGSRMAQGLAWLALIFFVGVVVRMGRDLMRAGSLRASIQKRETASGVWRKLEAAVAEIKTQPIEATAVESVYEALHRVLEEGVLQAFGLDPRSAPRTELSQSLAERGLPPELWAGLVEVWEYAEAVRFAVRAGGASAHDAVRDLPQWKSRTQSLISRLSQLSLSR